MATEETLEDVLDNNYDKIIGLRKTASYGFKFFEAIKPIWLEEIAANNYPFSYSKPNAEYCDHEMFDDYCLFTCNNPINRTGNCFKNVTLPRIDSPIDFEKVYRKKPDEDIVNLLSTGYNMFRLRVPDYGEGGNLIQKVSRFIFPTIDLPEIKIFPEEDLFPEEYVY
jgi:hypothetical protein